MPSAQEPSQYDADLAAAPDGAELGDWLDVSGPSWLNHAAWTMTDDVWHLPGFSGNQFAFRRYGGNAFHGDGGMPDLYQVVVRIRPTGPDGTIAVCPYYLSPTQYCLVLLDRKAKTVSLWEMNGVTPTSGTKGTYDLSQNHRGWQPLPSPDADGAYTIKTKVNSEWHSLAVWVGTTWIDTPKVDSVTSQPHSAAIRTSGSPQEILGISITKYSDPYQAR
jgi:hypothetical protein